LLPKTPKPRALTIKSLLVTTFSLLSVLFPLSDCYLSIGSVFWLEEGVSEWFGPEEGFGEVEVVLRRPEVSSLLS